MADLTFKANLLPNSDLGKALGSSTQRWNIYGELNGNASSADKWKNARTLTIGNKSQNIDGSNDISYSSHDINFTNIAIGTATSWNYTTPGVYGVASSAAFTGEGHPESTNGGLTPYRYGQLLVYRASSYGISQFYISHHDSSSSSYGIKYRTGWNSNYESTWSTLLDSTNYANYTVPKTGGTMTGQLYVNLDQDVGLNQNGSIVIGNKAGLNIGIDDNEIMARNNSAASTLNLNIEGGNICTSTMYPYAAQKTLGLTGATQHYYRLYLGGPTADSKSLNSGNPFIEFCDSDRSQYGQIIYTDFNNQGGSDSFSFRSNQNDLRVYAPKLHGAVWNDYAEFRQSKITEPGRCIKETGNGELVLTTKRLEKGCEIISDTYGFAIGESDKCKTPTAAVGRVLAIPYEDKAIFKQHIGDPVCSGPNGTISVMTEEEEMRYPSRIIGTVSEIPDYDIWHAGDDGKLEIKVNGRIWIRIR